MASLLEDIKKRLRETDGQATITESKDKIDGPVMDKAFQEGEPAPQPKKMQADKDNDPATVAADNAKIKKGERGDIRPTGSKPAPKQVNEDEDEVIKDDQEVVEETADSDSEIEEVPADEYVEEISSDDYKVVAEDIDIADDLAALFGSDETLSEDFKSRIEALFKTAVVAKINEATEAIAQSANEVIAQSREAIYEEVVDKVDLYIEKRIIPEWIEENKVAIQSNVKLQVMESFMDNLRSLFEAHYIEVPEEQEDLLESAVTEVERLEGELNEEIQARMELVEELETLKKAMIVAEVSEGLSANQAAKLKQLSEAVEYEDDESYVAKVEELKEAYFSRKVKRDASATDDTPVMINEETRKTGAQKDMDVASAYITKMFGSK